MITHYIYHINKIIVQLPNYFLVTSKQGQDNRETTESREIESEVNMLAKKIIILASPGSHEGVNTPKGFTLCKINR